MQTHEHFKAWKERADRLFTEVYAPVLGPESSHRACMMKAISVYFTADREVSEPVFQAGTASWRLRPDEFDGFTHFSYQFEITAARRLLAVDILPEMHCWVFDRSTGWVIDLAAVDQPKQAKEMLRVEWGSEYLPIPDFNILHESDTTQDRVVYHADVDAVRIAFELLTSLHRSIGVSPEYLRKTYGPETVAR